VVVSPSGEVAKLFFNDTCASGELVASDASGRGIRWTIAPDTTTSLTISAAYVGVLLGATIATTGTIADVLIMPGITKGT